MTTETAKRPPTPIAPATSPSKARQSKRGKREPLHIRDYVDMSQLEELLQAKFAKGVRFSVGQAADYLSGLTEETLGIWTDYGRTELPQAVEIGCEELAKADLLQSLRLADGSVRYTMLSA